MPLPLLPIIPALLAGGSLVPHAAGGLIVSGASGYVAGTYLSSAAIASLLTGAGAALGAGVLTVTGVAGAIIGSALIDRMAEAGPAGAARAAAEFCRALKAGAQGDA